MDAFNRAWALLKMPYHGTSSKRWEEIQQTGSLKPSSDAMGALRVWFTGNPNEALYHSMDAVNTDREKGLQSHPVIIHSKPTQEMEAGNDNPRFWTSETDVPSDTFSQVWSDENYRPAESGQERIDSARRYRTELEEMERE